MNKKEIEEIIRKLVNIGERQGDGEVEARNFIVNFLKTNKISYKLQYFKTGIPKVKKESLIIDGKKILARATSFVGGKIDGKYNLISSLTSSQNFIDRPNINFNPLSRSISRSNHYFAPALAVKASDISKIIKAKKVKGEIIIGRQNYRSANILVGNTSNPQNIFFSHYDSIGPGAVDNASGVALSLYIIKSYPNVLKDSLFVVAGNEELSYDYPIYWGHGYRVFERKYKKQLNKAKNIYVLDCIGQTKSEFVKDEKLTMLAFPIKEIKSLAKKISVVAGGFDELMTIYHSDADTLDKVNINEIIKTARRIRNRLT